MACHLESGPGGKGAKKVFGMAQRLYRDELDQIALDRGVWVKVTLGPADRSIALLPGERIVHLFVCLFPRLRTPLSKVEGEH